MSILKSFARDWLPPAIVRALQRRRGDGIRFEGDYLTWEDASAQCTGYDAEPILAKVLEATLKVKRGEAVFERDSVVFDEVEYSWPLLTGLMWASARNSGRLNVLDFGGALGSSYFQNRDFLQRLTDFHWNVVEQEHYVIKGQENIQNDHLRFYRSIENCLIDNQPNVVLLSSVLQYLESPFDIINKLTLTGATCLLIDRTPFSDGDTDKILVQKVPSSIYRASYPMRVFSLQKFRNMIETDWRLVASNLSPEAYVQTSDKFEFSFQGMLLEARR